ncbi:MAG: hypothetical protein AAB430_00395 [Patescibacteria group bacterium]
MNRILVPKVTFKNIIADESRIKIAYARIFEIARDNILMKRRLTKGMTHKYNEVQYGKQVSDNRGSGYEATS